MDNSHCAWFCRAMFNVQCLAQLIKLMVARGLAFAAGKPDVGEPLAAFGQNFLYLDQARVVQCVQERAIGSGRLVALDLNEQPARGAVIVHKQIEPAGLVGSLEQVFSICLGVKRTVAFEGFVRLRGLFCIWRIEVANPVAALATVKTRVCGMRANELSRNSQQVIQRQQQQHLSKHDHDVFLSGCEFGLKSVRSVRCVMKAVSALLLITGANSGYRLESMQ